ncbi:MAG: helix-turn-helix transcriptional regulator [Rhizobiales bacterium]|nr:helix-turn-helix transcriptional regulator [Hyphomicrobiales bacterium]
MTELIGSRLLYIRTESGLAQRPFAKMVGVSFSTWQTIEGGKNVPSGETLLKLAAQGWNPGWILTGRGAPRLDGEMAVVATAKDVEAIFSSRSSPQAAAKAPAKADNRDQPIAAEALEAAIAFLEQWLAENRRAMTPEKKARVVTMIYQFVIEDAEAGQPSIDRRKLGQFLRLVA